MHSNRVKEPGEFELLNFGMGHLYVQTGAYEGRPAVFIAKASKRGPIGTNNPEEDGDPHSLKPGEYVLTFPTEGQAQAVANAICPPAIPGAGIPWKPTPGDQRGGGPVSTPQE